MTVINKLILTFKTIVAASLLVSSGVIFTACEEKRPSDRFLIPKDYVGWVLVSYEVKDAPELPQKDGHNLIKFPPSGILKTSSKPKYGSATDEYYYYSNDSRQELPTTASGGNGLIWGGGTGSTEGFPVNRKMFVGTEEQFKKCGSENSEPGLLSEEKLKECLGK